MPSRSLTQSVFNKRLPLHPSIPGKCLTQKPHGLRLTPNFPSPGNPLKQSHWNLSEEHRRPSLPDDQHKQEKTFQGSESVKNQEGDRQTVWREWGKSRVAGHRS